MAARKRSIAGYYSETSERGDPVVRALRRDRIARNLSLDLVAQRAGVHRNALCRWERCGASPVLTSLQAWAGALGYEVTLKEKT